MKLYRTTIIAWLRYAWHSALYYLFRALARALRRVGSWPR